jgi:hypothetical protein
MHSFSSIPRPLITLTLNAQWKRAGPITSMMISYKLLIPNSGFFQHICYQTRGNPNEIIGNTKKKKSNVSGMKYSLLF